jgi:ankyrin repeat protein
MKRFAFVVVSLLIVAGGCYKGPQIVSGPTTGAPHPALLIRAAEGGDIGEIRTLLVNGADVTATDPGGETALFRAAQNGHPDCAAALLDAGASTSAARASDGATPLHIAAQRGHTLMAYLLVDRGADVNARDAEGRTPLMLAAAEGHRIAVEMLLKKGADVGAKDGKGQTALDIARKAGNQEIVDVLDAYEEPMTPGLQQRPGSR